MCAISNLSLSVLVEKGRETVSMILRSVVAVSLLVATFVRAQQPAVDSTYPQEADTQSVMLDRMVVRARRYAFNASSVTVLKANDFQETSEPSSIE